MKFAYTHALVHVDEQYELVHMWICMHMLQCLEDSLQTQSLGVKALFV